MTIYSWCIYLWKEGIFHSYVSLPEGIPYIGDTSDCFPWGVDTILNAVPCSHQSSFPLSFACLLPFCILFLLCSHCLLNGSTIWLFNMAMENGSCIYIYICIWFSVATLNYQRVESHSTAMIKQDTTLQAVHDDWYHWFVNRKREMQVVTNSHMTKMVNPSWAMNQLDLLVKSWENQRFFF